MKSETITLPRELTVNMAEAIAFEANCCGGIASDIWEALVAAAPVDDGWIVCSDRLPENHGDINLYSSNLGVVNGYYYKPPSKEDDFMHGFYLHSGDHPGGMVDDVTHWRPLPPPPPMKKDPE